MRKLLCLITIFILFSCKQGSIEITSKNVKKNQKQTCNLLPTINSNNKVNISLDELTKKEYISKKNNFKNTIETFSNSDSIESILLHIYPKVFFKDKNHLSIKFKDKKRSFVNNISQDKTYSSYSIVGKFKNYIIISESFYEGWNHVVINVVTKQFYILPYEPIFITENLFYSYSNFYGDENLTVIDVLNKEEISFIFPNVLFKESYNISSHIRFKVECMSSGEEKYLEILK